MKLKSTFLALVLCLFGASGAQANPLVLVSATVGVGATSFTLGMGCFADDTKSGALSCKIAMVSSSARDRQERLAYLNMVQEDAADFVAADGVIPPSALLKPVLDAARESLKANAAQRVSDRDLALAILEAQGI